MAVFEFIPGNGKKYLKSNTDVYQFNMLLSIGSFITLALTGHFRASLVTIVRHSDIEGENDGFTGDRITFVVDCHSIGIGNPKGEHPFQMDSVFFACNAVYRFDRSDADCASDIGLPGGIACFFDMGVFVCRCIQCNTLDLRKQKWMCRFSHEKLRRNSCRTFRSIYGNREYYQSVPCGSYAEGIVLSDFKRGIDFYDVSLRSHSL